MTNKNKNEIKIHIRQTIPASKRRVFAALLGMKDFHTFMPNVKESKVLESGKNSALMKWHVEIENFPIRWAERNIINRKLYTISFKAIDGDLHLFEGRWKVTDDDEGAAIDLQASIETGIPFLQKLVGNILQKKIEKNFEEILISLERHVREDYYRVNLPVKNLSGYGLIGHPYNYAHMLRYLHSLNPGMKVPSREFLGKLFDMTPPHKACDVNPIDTPSGLRSFGHFIVCPIIPEMLDVNLEAVFERVIGAIRVAETLRCGIVTLGGFTSIAGERFGREIPKLVQVPVTTGNTFTAALTI